MTVVLTIRDIPEEVRNSLRDEAARRGQSMQAYLVGVLKERAKFNRNLALLNQAEQDLQLYGGVEPGAPRSAEILREARKEAGQE
jgi:plasmid stability protein